MTMLLIVGVILVPVVATWAIIGAAWVLYLDVMGRRNDYDADYPLTKAQLIMAGPIVWIMELKKKGNDRH